MAKKRKLPTVPLTELKQPQAPDLGSVAESPSTSGQAADVGSTQEADGNQQSLSAGTNDGTLQWSASMPEKQIPRLARLLVLDWRNMTESWLSPDEFATAWTNSNPVRLAEATEQLRMERNVGRYDRILPILDLVLSKTTHINHVDKGSEDYSRLTERFASIFVGLLEAEVGRREKGGPASYALDPALVEITPPTSAVAATVSQQTKARDDLRGQMEGASTVRTGEDNVACAGDNLRDPADLKQTIKEAVIDAVRKGILTEREESNKDALAIVLKGGAASARRDGFVLSPGLMPGPIGDAIAKLDPDTRQIINLRIPLGNNHRHLSWRKIAQQFQRKGKEGKTYSGERLRQLYQLALQECPILVEFLEPKGKRHTSRSTRSETAKDEAGEDVDEEVTRLPEFDLRDLTDADGNARSGYQIVTNPNSPHSRRPTS